MVDCVAIFVAAVYCTAIGYTARGVCSITVIVVIAGVCGCFVISDVVAFACARGADGLFVIITDAVVFAVAIAVVVVVVAVVVVDIVVGVAIVVMCYVTICVVVGFVDAVGC